MPRGERRSGSSRWTFPWGHLSGETYWRLQGQLSGRTLTASKQAAGNKYQARDSIPLGTSRFYRPTALLTSSGFLISSSKNWKKTCSSADIGGGPAPVCLLRSTISLIISSSTSFGRTLKVPDSSQYILRIVASHACLPTSSSSHGMAKRFPLPQKN